MAAATASFMPIFYFQTRPCVLSFGASESPRPIQALSLEAEPRSATSGAPEFCASAMFLIKDVFSDVFLAVAGFKEGWHSGPFVCWDLYLLFWDVEC